MAKSLTAKGQFWKAKIEQWQESQQTIKDWCIERNVSYNTFQYWRQRLGFVNPRNSGTPSSFIELPEDNFSSSGIELEVNGVTLRLQPDFDDRALARCLQILRGLKC